MQDFTYNSSKNTSREIIFNRVKEARNAEINQNFFTLPGLILKNNPEDSIELKLSQYFKNSTINAVEKNTKTYYEIKDNYRKNHKNNLKLNLYSNSIQNYMQVANPVGFAWLDYCGAWQKCMPNDIKYSIKNMDLSNGQSGIFAITIHCAREDRYFGKADLSRMRDESYQNLRWKYPKYSVQTYRTTPRYDTAYDRIVPITNYIHQCAYQYGYNADFKETAYAYIGGKRSPMLVLVANINKGQKEVKESLVKKIVGI